MGLFGSGAQGFVSFSAQRFVAAGKYGYVDTANSKTATISVPVTAQPTSAPSASTFTITWAVARTAGYVFDVQIKRPGSTAFANWKHGVTDLTGQFIPDHGAGKYSFRARLRLSANGAASGYSSAVVITAS
jgi:hypothetical protein